MAPGGSASWLGREWRLSAGGWACGPAGARVRGVEIPGEVGERPTPNRTHRSAAGGARESGAVRSCVRA